MCARAARPAPRAPSFFLNPPHHFFPSLSHINTLTIVTMASNPSNSCGSPLVALKAFGTSWWKLPTFGGNNHSAALSKVLSERKAKEIVVMSETRKYGLMWSSVLPSVYEGMLLKSNNGYHEVVASFPHKLYFYVKNSCEDPLLLVESVKLILQHFPGADVSACGSMSPSETSYIIRVSNYVIANAQEQDQVKLLVSTLPFFQSSCYVKNYGLISPGQGRGQGKHEGVVQKAIVLPRGLVPLPPDIILARDRIFTQLRRAVLAQLKSTQLWRRGWRLFSASLILAANKVRKYLKSIVGVQQLSLRFAGVNALRSSVQPLPATISAEVRVMQALPAVKNRREPLRIFCHVYSDGALIKSTPVTWVRVGIDSDYFQTVRIENIGAHLLDDEEKLMTVHFATNQPPQTVGELLKAGANESNIRAPRNIVHSKQWLVPRYVDDNEESFRVRRRNIC